MSTEQAHPYATYLDIKFPSLAVVDVSALVRACTEQWYNQTLCKVNDSVVRLGVMQGEYHWHKHTLSAKPKELNKLNSRKL
jgi:hypothetical protein